MLQPSKVEQDQALVLRRTMMRDHGIDIMPGGSVYLTGGDKVRQDPMITTEGLDEMM